MPARLVRWHRAIVPQCCFAQRSYTSSARAAVQATKSTTAANDRTQSATQRHKSEKPRPSPLAEKQYRDSFFPTPNSKHKRRGQHNIKRQLFGDSEPHVPAYPYGEARLFKQSNRGLYGGRRIQYGHSVSEKNRIKTRKRWKVNVQHKTLYSEALKKEVKVRVAARVLRTIDKVGGLDNYVIGGTPARIKELGVTGWMLRYRITNTLAIQERFRAQRLALGLPADGIGLIGLEDTEAAAEAAAARVSITPHENVAADEYVRRLLEAATLVDLKPTSAETL